MEPEQNQINPPIDGVTPQQQVEPPVVSQPVVETVTPSAGLRNETISPIEIAKPEEVNPNSPLVIVLQWLTYTFWIGLVFSASFLIGSTLSFFLTKANMSETALYGVAAVVVFGLAAVICDSIYTRHEPIKKTGFASVLMVIYAVIFGILTIGSLVATAFSLVTLIIATSQTEVILTGLYTALIVSVLLGLVFIRVILPIKLVPMRRVFVVTMVLAGSAIIIASLFGPIADVWQRRADRRIEQNLQSVVEGVNKYSEDKNELPNTLADANLKGDAKKLVDDNLVEYRKNTQPSQSDYASYSGSDRVYFYQLCVKYQKASESDYPSYYRENDDDYSPYISTSYHPAGQVCYKVVTSYYGSIEPATPLMDSSSQPVKSSEMN